MKKVLISEDDLIIGWFDTDINSSIPSEAIEISEDDFFKAIESKANAYKDGVFFKKEKTEGEKIKSLQMSLMSLCDTKQEQAQQLILGYKATPLQIERYKDKYDRAKLNEFDEETNKVIIGKYEEYLKQIRNLVDLIEYFRGIVDDLINANELDKAENLIKMGENFDANTTYEKIIEMIK